MITEDFVSVEIQDLLNKKGFDFLSGSIQAIGMYDIKHNDDGTAELEKCCTHQMAMKWLREEKEIYITIIYGDYPSLNKVFWTPQIDSLEGIDLPDSFYKEYNTYEEACEAAIKYCLENLI